MKKQHKISLFFLLLITLGVLFSGCKKFLDRKPLSATLDDYSTPIDGLVIGMYKVMFTYGGFSNLGWIGLSSMRDDDAKKGSSDGDLAQLTSIYDNYQYSKNEGTANDFWNDHYYLINKANQVLYVADSLKVTDEASLRNVGEAHFMRAYSYFELVKTFGPVPKIDFYYTDASKGIRPKSTEAEIYALIDLDLDSASRYLPATWANAATNQNPFPGRLTKYAAKALWARAYLFRQNWSQVLSLCNEVMASGQYSLLPNFVDVWKDGVSQAGKNSKESIFEFQAYVGAGGSPDYGSYWGTCQNVRQGNASSDWDLGWGFNVPADKLVNDWDSTDPRKAATILYSGQYDGGTATGGYGNTLPSGMVQNYWNKKVYADPAMRSYTGFLKGQDHSSWIDHRIIRYAEVILMKAEAANESGDGATAEAMLELIRARAKGSNSAVLPKITYTTQDSMRTAIKNERRWELAMEGFRFYDLVRWGDAITVLSPLGYTDKCRYYPIPQNAIDLSGGVLAQNPEW